MGRPYQILFPLFSLFLVRVDLTDLKPLPINVTILKVYDGDTVLVQSGFFKSKVRLSRIDAPEKGQPFATGIGDAGDLARKCLMKLLSSKAELTIEGIDLYGRILGDLDEVSFQLVEQGCVSIYPHAKFESQQQKYVFLRALIRSKFLKKGLWAFGGVEQPKAWRKKHKKVFRTRT